MTAVGGATARLVTSSRAGKAGVGGADWLEKAKARGHLRTAGRVLAGLIAARPDFDPRQWPAHRAADCARLCCAHCLARAAYWRLARAGRIMGACCQTRARTKNATG